MRIKRLFRSNKGFSLIEMIVVLMTFGFVLLASTSFLVFSVGITRSTTDASQSQDMARQIFTFVKSEGGSAYMAYLTRPASLVNPATSGINGISGSFAELDVGTLIFYADTVVDGAGNIVQNRFAMDEITGTPTSKSRTRRATLPIYDGTFDLKFYISELDAGTIINSNVVRVEVTFINASNQRGGVQTVTYEDEIYLKNLSEITFHKHIPACVPIDPANLNLGYHFTGAVPLRSHASPSGGFTKINGISFQGYPNITAYTANYEMLILTPATDIT